MTDLASEMKALRELLPIDVHITPEFLEQKFKWSLETFGPGYKLKSVTASHQSKSLEPSLPSRLSAKHGHGRIGGP